MSIILSSPYACIHHAECSFFYRVPYTNQQIFHHSMYHARMCVLKSEGNQGRIQGEPLNFIKRGKTSRACTRKCRVLVLNSYPDPPPFQNPVSPVGNLSILGLKLRLLLQSVSVHMGDNIIYRPIQTRSKYDSLKSLVCNRVPTQVL